MNNRIVLIAGWAIFLATPVIGQEGTARRTSLGDPIATPVGEPPRYAENSGWSEGSFSIARWGVEYGTELNHGEPWSVVLQSDRYNAALAAGANKLTLDLNGHQYQIQQYRTVLGDNHSPLAGGLLNIHGGSDTGAYLRVTSGTLDVGRYAGASINVGNHSLAGDFRVDHASVSAREIHVGAAANSPGEVFLGDQGKLTAGSSLYVGDAADGTVILNGADSQLNGNSIQIGNASAEPIGTVIVNHPDALVQTDAAGNLSINNPVPSEIQENIGLIINAGRVDVGGNLKLGTSDAYAYGAATINGGTLRVEDRVIFASPSRQDVVSGGKLFLHGGELSIASVNAFHPTITEQFYWDAGTIRYRAANVTLNESQITKLTKQGAITYGGERQAGTIATGQVLASDGTMGFIEGDIGLAGGTISPTGRLRIDANASISGYGRINTEVVGSGTIINDSGKVLAIGALGGANTIQGSGPFRVGHLNQSTTYGGMARGGGGFYKVGVGTQTVAGTLNNSGGVFIEQGGLAFEGDSASLTASQMTIAAGGTLELRSGSSGTINGTLTNAGQVTVTDATFMVDGSFVNNGQLTNNGTISGSIISAGRITGTGSFTGTVDILAGSVLAPGNSIETQYFEDLTLHAGGEFEFEISTVDGLEGVGWDLTSVSDLLSWAASSTDPFVVAIKSLGVLSGFDSNQAYSWRFIAAALDNPGEWNPERFVVDISEFETGDSLSQDRFSVFARPDGLYLNYASQPAAVPEPSSLVLLLGVMPLMYYAARRRGGLRSLVNRSQKPDDPYDRGCHGCNGFGGADKPTPEARRYRPMTLNSTAPNIRL